MIEKDYKQGSENKRRNLNLLIFICNTISFTFHSFKKSYLNIFVRSSRVNAFLLSLSLSVITCNRKKIFFVRCSFTIITLQSEMGRHHSRVISLRCVTVNHSKLLNLSHSLTPYLAFQVDFFQFILQVHETLKKVKTK